MKFLWNKKDGGPESRVWMYGLEIKSLFSILLLRFEDGSREAYHSHAFNCFSWVLSGGLLERFVRTRGLPWFVVRHAPSWRGFSTHRDTFHKVTSIGRTWVLTFRGPWAGTWQEYTKERGLVTLTHGRKEVQP